MADQKNAVLCAVTGYLSVISFGYTVGYSSPALPQMTAEKEILHEKGDAASWFGSFATLGGMLGCLIAGWCVERMGRRLTLAALSVPFFVGWICIAAGSDISVLNFGRFLTGISSGACCVAVPMYIAETVPATLRGALGAGVQLSVTVGILLAYSIGMFLTWRQLAAFGMVLPIVALVASLLLPESPRYLVNCRRNTDAITALVWLRGNLTLAQNECRELEKSLADGTDQATVKELFTRRELVHPVFVALGVQVLQQATGVNVVIYYTVSIFQAAGYKDSGGMATVAVGIVQVAATALACSMMDRRGRRQMLIIAGVGQAASNGLLAAYYYISSSSSSSSSSSLGWLALFSVLSYIVAFSIGWGPVPMLLVSEIFPSRARGLASSIAMLVNWLLAFCVTRYFAAMQVAFGLDGCFMLFAVACVVAVVFVAKYVPETKGRSLEEIEHYFAGREFVRGVQL